MRATVSCSSGCTSPSRAVQRTRLWASTAQASQAALAKNLPDGQCVEAGAVFEVADRELDRCVVAVELVDLNDGQVEVGDERVVTPVGPQLCLDRIDEAGAAHHEPELAPLLLVVTAGHIAGLGDRGLAAVGIHDRRPRLLGDGVNAGSQRLAQRDGDRPAHP